MNLTKLNKPTTKLVATLLSLLTPSVSIAKQHLDNIPQNEINVQGIESMTVERLEEVFKEKIMRLGELVTIRESNRNRGIQNILINDEINKLKIELDRIKTLIAKKKTR